MAVRYTRFLLKGGRKNLSQINWRCLLQRLSGARRPFSPQLAVALAVAVAALFLADAASALCTGTSCDGKCMKEPYPGAVFYSTGGYDPSNMSPDMCKGACAAVNGMELAGITNGKVCLCGKENNGGACE